MSNRRGVVAILLAGYLFACAGGCSNRQGYMALQDWQRQQCQRVLDKREREACFDKAATSYEEYRKSAGQERRF